MASGALANANEDDFDFKLSYRVEEVVIATGIGRSTIYEHLKSGRLKAKKDGNTTLILKSEMMRYLNELPDWVTP